MNIISKCISSLEKVMPDTLIDSLEEYAEATALKNEIFNYQIAYTLPGKGRLRLSVETSSTISDITVRAVGFVPSLLPCYDDHDGYIISDKPGLFPDVLENITESGFTVSGSHTSVLWITVDPHNAVPATHHIKVILRNGEESVCETLFTLRILDAKLEEQSLIYTNWFHADCLCDRYAVPAFSERHWEIIANYMKTAADHGMNMILTPIFTPALDTAFGHERTTVQLLDVKKDGSSYSFGFEKLIRWIDTAGKNGIEYFELAPLYTQWGAAHAPKIIAEEKGETKRIFGWETDAYGEEYVEFLSQLLPSLVEFFKKRNMQSRVFFHVSDEPSADDPEKYYAAAALLKKYTCDDFNIIDALSSYSFYETGAVKTPVVSTNHIRPFIENGVRDLWCYYCCGQYKDVANRFMAMPSLRNRILGVQLYKYDIKGFLQWGYNFWNSVLSYEKIDPYYVTDAKEAYPSGDAFIVYPGNDGHPVCSLRLEVFYDGLQDYRALKALEKKIGREKTISLIDFGLSDKIDFNSFPHSNRWLLDLRETVNRILSEK